MAIEGLGQTAPIQQAPEVNAYASHSASQSIDQLGSAKNSSSKERSTIGCIWDWICKIFCCLWCCDSKESPSKKPYLIDLDSLKASLPNYEISIGSVYSSDQKNPEKCICFKGKDDENHISFHRNGQKYHVFYADGAYREFPDDILQAIAIELKKSPERFTITNGMKWPLYDVTSEEFDVAADGGIEDVRYLAPKGIRYDIKDPFRENAVVGSAKVCFTTRQTQQKVSHTTNGAWIVIGNDMPLVIHDSQGLRLAASEALLHRLIQDHGSVFLMKCPFKDLLGNKFTFEGFHRDESRHPMKYGYLVSQKTN